MCGVSQESHSGSQNNPAVRSCRSSSALHVEKWWRRFARRSTHLLFGHRPAMDVRQLALESPRPKVEGAI